MSSWASSVSANPFKESVVKPSLPTDLVRTLQKLSVTRQPQGGLISEQFDIDFNDDKDGET